jgi:protease-4
LIFTKACRHFVEKLEDRRVNFPPFSTLRLRLPSLVRHWTPLVAVGLALLTAQGCMTISEPLKLQVNGDIRGQIAPTEPRQPVFPSLLPYHRSNPQSCLVAVVDVDGLLLDADSTGLGSWGENAVSLFRERLDAIQCNPRVRAVVLRIHSPGGSVTATDIMWHDLQSFRGRTKVPVVACLMDVATGGAYYLATGSDVIIAQPTGVTGAIGCILNVYNLQDLMAQFNIVGIPVKAGKNIDLGSPIKALDPEGRKVLQAMADEFHHRFREVVINARPRVDPRLETTFDGRVFTASQARDLGLIDEIGYLDDAVVRARDLAGISRSAEIVLYHREGDPALSPYSVTPNVPLQDKLIPVNVPGLNRSRLPSFLYLWEMDPTVEAITGK